MRIKYSLLALLISGLVFILSASFSSDSAANPDSSATPTVNMELNTDELYYAEFYDYIFRGHFENLKMTREDTEFLMIFDKYLRTYGTRCASFLPADKVQIMNLVCDVEEVTTFMDGHEERNCVKYKWVPSGLYARPELYDAMNEVERIQSKGVIGMALAMIADPNAIGNSVDQIHKVNGLRNDMAEFFQLNQCNSEGVRRFEENLKRFALNGKSIRMQGVSKYAAVKESGGPTGPQDFSRFLDDLVANQSKTWAFNRYVPGSISGISIQATDSKGRPLKLYANYMYKGFAGNSKGGVSISFENGLPKCIYFADFPNNCKTPNSSIVAAYAQGNYGN